MEHESKIIPFPNNNRNMAARELKRQVNQIIYEERLFWDVMRRLMEESEVYPFNPN